ncbi:hypothetical protein BDV37DRAFT_258510 [Aspergillus pseudonomiae]|uniref:Uncharacterized protein n=1 Tax=Aspergillus pseudonomiae TaxID=1506151 RepID=A0A5N7D175_9EURO|nr:uncharacterized protein BDV37DRAFT_258510 [Aspergillus pseudonomiae]KAE8400170.1 hypothetical protein BDV37DRAFT_258510 [Aspergillus pseudonomiae]
MLTTLLFLFLLLIKAFCLCIAAYLFFAMPPSKFSLSYFLFSLPLFVSFAQYVPRAGDSSGGFFDFFSHLHS